ncbi:hypothetical protein PUN28_019073 [Cardiocondyla obscurior]|uniref:Uncharacterized protein n=1 Tax=Cardiocondyla obscurior TaxID=286306 RepID=A0AAW2EFA8_9HYME
MSDVKELNGQKRQWRSIRVVRRGNVQPGTSLKERKRERKKKEKERRRKEDKERARYARCFLRMSPVVDKNFNVLSSD